MSRTDERRKWMYFKGNLTTYTYLISGYWTTNVRLLDGLSGSYTFMLLSPIGALVKYTDEGQNWPPEPGVKAGRELVEDLEVGLTLRHTHYPAPVN